MDVLVVGAGQAGLAVGYHLRRLGLDAQLVDAGSEVGHVWRSRWNSLRLFTPAQYSGLPGLPFPAPDDTHVGRAEVADYLGQYAKHAELPIRFDARVTSLNRLDGGFSAELSDGERLPATQVVVATGAYAIPYVPADLAVGVPSVHTSAYREPSQLPGDRVLIVGGGNSGMQIADELALAGRRVTLAEGHQNRAIPQRLLGRDIFWWLTRVGVMRAPVEGRLGQRMKAGDGTVIGTRRKDLVSRGVVFRPRLVSAEGAAVQFEDGASAEVDAVVWATGFRHDDSFVAVPEALDARGVLRQRHGVVDGVPGLYTIGRPWQRNIGSSLLGFVQYDAAVLAETVLADRQR
ncbi:flavin-containing monooxygenase [Tenggerimyces flavus]|uniref:Flavin-containing monooxygenase n=1 Tax=Tenggerimyces flavus TaxID=1708749 RepID=A0ABV7Y6M4_9ACTN|nr:NAD(P)/FAD-dependent oxidoreductase [Tenggerimyces flavus]MBM7785337.1 putative flavoprotein involved in K+ transport [Tenggerimyces flavus]